MVAITTGILGALLYGTASSALGSVLTPDTVAEWGPAVALVGLVAVARWGTWQGPVVFAAPDVPFLLGAPLRAQRAGGAAVRARPGAPARGAAAVVGGVALVGLAGEGRGIDAGRAVGLVAGVALLGVLGVAGAGRVQCSARWARAIGLALPASLAVGAGLVAVASASATGRRVVLWSGPWGWALQPVSGTTAASLLALGAAGGRDGRSPSRARRAASSTARPSATPCAPRRAAERMASAWGLDARTARLSLRRAAGPARRRAARGLRAPRQPELGDPVARRDASALRAPQRTLGSAALAARRGGGRHRRRRPPGGRGGRRPGQLRRREHAARAAARGDRPSERLARAPAPSVRPHPARPRRRADRRRWPPARPSPRIGLAVAGALPARGGALALAGDRRSSRPSSCARPCPRAAAAACR